MKKRYLATAFILVMMLAMTSVSVLAIDSNVEQQEMGVLYYGPDNIKIRAKQSDIDVFIYAEYGEQKEAALSALVSNPANEVTELAEVPFVLVEDNSGESECAEVEAEAAFTRSPGTWTITAFSIDGGSTTSIRPTDASYFDVAYNESVSVTYTCSPDRLISTMCETSTPSVFYDPDMNSGVTHTFFPRESGQYRIYFKNYSSSTASISGGPVKIYS